MVRLDVDVARFRSVRGACVALVVALACGSSALAQSTEIVPERLEPTRTPNPPAPIEAVPPAPAPVAEVPAATAPIATHTEPRPKVYLMCPQECFEDYLRQELSYFDLVRDPLLAEFTVLIVRQPAANGGERFSVTISRMNEGQDEGSASRSFVSDPAATAAINRSVLRGVVLRGLHVELIGTPYEQAFTVELPARDADAVSHLDDPWNYWVVSPEFSASTDGIGSFFEADFEAGLHVRRITADSKFRNRASYARGFSGYTLEDGSRPRGDVYRWNNRILYSHSLGERLSLGGIVGTWGSEFENTKGHVHGGAVLELNAFPFSQNARRQLRFAYQIGSWSNWYFERTARNRTRETHGYHAFSVIADVNQRWGSVQWIGQLNQFLDEPGLFKVSTGANLTLRIAAGLSISFEGEFAYVKDQITLRQRPVTDLELLLWTAQQPTDHRFYGQISLSYTFGSVFNTIVNPRFARIDLEED